MTRVAGLEVDRTRLRMAIFDGTPKKYELVDFVEAEIAAGSDDERREVLTGILTDILSRKENQGLEVVTGIDARVVMLREITVPYLKAEVIAKTIRFEAEGHLHSKSIEDVVVEYIKCGETETSSRLVICAAEKALLRKHLEELQSVGIDPVAIELDATGLATAFANTPLYSGEQNVLLLEIEPDCSRMVFIEKNRVAKIRSVWGRGGAISRPDRLLSNSSASASNGLQATTTAGSEDTPGSSLEQRFREIERSLIDLDQFEGDSSSEDLPIAVVSDEEYARLTGRQGSTEISDEGATASPGSSPGQGSKAAAAEPSRSTAALVARESDPLERLFTEIERTFATYLLANPIDLIVVTGSRAEELGAVEKLAERFEVDVVPFDIGDSFSIRWQGDRQVLNRSGAIACGLGLRALGKGFTDFDLRQDEFKFERRFAKLMPSLSLLAVMCAMLTFVWAFHNFYEGKRTGREVEALQERQAALFEQFFDRKPANTQGAVVTEAKKALEKLRGPGAELKGSRTRFKNYLDPLEMFNDIANCVNLSVPRVYPRWERIDFNTEVDKGKSKATVFLKSQEEVVSFETALKARSALFDVTVNSKTGKDGEVEVTLELELKQRVIDERGARGK